MDVFGNESLYCRFYDKADTANYVGFLADTCKKYGESLIFPDDVASQVQDPDSFLQR